jgi:hypothetical protein
MMLTIEREDLERRSKSRRLKREESLQCHSLGFVGQSGYLYQ